MDQEALWVLAGVGIWIELSVAAVLLQGRRYCRGCIVVADQSLLSCCVQRRPLDHVCGAGTGSG